MFRYRRTSCALSCDLTVRSAFKATYKEPRQQDRNSETQTHFFPVRFLLPSPYPNVAIRSFGKGNIPQACNLSTKLLDWWRLIGVNWLSRLIHESLNILWENERSW